MNKPTKLTILFYGYDDMRVLACTDDISLPRMTPRMNGPLTLALLARLVLPPDDDELCRWEPLFAEVPPDPPPDCSDGPGEEAHRVAVNRGIPGVVEEPTP